MGKNQIIVKNINTRSMYSTLMIGRGPAEAVHVNSIRLAGDTLNVEAEPLKTIQYKIDCGSTVPLKLLGVVDRPGVLLSDSMLAFLHNHNNPENSTMYASLSVSHFIWKYPQVKIRYIDELSVNLVQEKEGWQRHIQ